MISTSLVTCTRPLTALLFIFNRTQRHPVSLWKPSVLGRANTTLTHPTFCVIIEFIRTVSL